MGSGNPPPEPRNRATPVRELAEEPRASLNNSYNIILLSHATGANKLKQLITKHHTLLTLRNTKLTRPPRGGSPLLGNKKWRSPRETTTPEVPKNYYKTIQEVFPLGKKLSELEHLRSGGLSLAVAFAFLRALCVRTMVVLVGDSGGTTLRNSNFRTLF